MEILQIDIGGKMAHFRKYYGNNTAMSYSIPPRTTIMGMLAAILGRPKESYYEEFSSKNLRIGIALKSPIKKNFHRLNFISLKKTKDLSKSFETDFRGMADNAIQTPFEVVSGLNLQTDDVIYRIFIACFDTGKTLFEALKNAILNQKHIFPISLGTANFNASISNITVFTDDQIKEKNAQNEWLLFDSAIEVDKISSFDFDREGSMNFIEEELLPADFKANFDRELVKMNRLLFSTRNMPIKVCYTGICYEIKNMVENQIIQFLD